MVTGIRYLGGFIGEQTSETEWIEWNVWGWKASMEVMYGDGAQTPTESIR